MNQTAVWKHKTGTNEYTESIYAPEASIPARIEERVRLVKDKTGNQVISRSTVFTMAQIKVDDLVDGKVALAVNNNTGLDGSIEGYEVMLE